jgi:hypothetical protein
MPPRVVVSMIGQLADLHAWGRDDRRRWWALISWTVYGNTSDGNAYRHLSAWVPAAALRRSADPSQTPLYRAVERLDLQGDASTWPTPAGTRGRVWTHYGAVTSPPEAPHGITTIPNADMPNADMPQ